VRRSHVLLGRTVDTGRVWDVIAAARYLRAQFPKLEVHVMGQGPAALLAAYAALWEGDVAGVNLRDPPPTHMDAAAPQLLNVLRVCDVPHAMGMLSPRPLTLCDCPADLSRQVAAVYAAAGAETAFTHLTNRPGPAAPDP
jgi:hypothetical protein